MKKLIVILAATLLSFSLQAEVSDFLSEMIDTETVTLGHASYLCVVHVEPERDSVSYSDAVAIALNNELVPLSWLSINKSNSDRKISLARLCAMMAKTFGVKGGTMYRATKGSPHYAFKQFQVDGIVPMSADSSLSVSGNEMLNMYTRCLRVYGEKK